MAADEVFGQPEFAAERADLVLEQFAQRLDELHVHALRQAADIVVRLDGDRRAAGEADALDDVGIERALREELGAADLLRLVLEGLDEQPADGLALGLGVGLALERREELPSRINVDERDVVVVAEHRHDLVGLVEPHQAVVDEDAGELVADRLVDQHRRDRGVDAAREAADHPALADLRADLLDHALAVGGHGPVGLRGRRCCGRSWRAACRRPACAPPRGGTSSCRALRPRSTAMANGAFGEVATTSKPAGSSVTRSPWLIHTG